MDQGEDDERSFLMSEDTPTNATNSGAELRLAYQDCLDNIRFAKRHFWQLIYYTILVDAALIGLAKLTEVNALSDALIKTVFVTLASLTALGSGYLLFDLEYFMAQQRRRMVERIFPHFSDAFRRTRFKKDEKYISLVWDINIIVLGGYSTFIGASIVIFYINGPTLVTLLLILFWFVVWIISTCIFIGWFQYKLNHLEFED